MSRPRSFVDTNVFAYALDGRDELKQQQAQRLIGTRRDDLVVSTQVLIELYAVCTRKLAMSRSAARSAVDAVSAFPVVDADRSLVRDGLRLSEAAQLSIFDAMVVCAAQRAGCDLLLTEDLSHGQQFAGLTITDPFAH